MSLRRCIEQLRKLSAVDRSVGYALLWRSWMAVAGLCTLPLIVRQLSLVEQGYYYTFASIAAAKVFFELGLGTVLTQFASHERAALVWTEKGTLDGDERAKGRLASLLRLCLKWYAGASALMVFVVLPSGLVFFHRQSSASPDVHWILPWVGVILGGAGSLLLTPIFSVLEGCGRVAEVARIRFIDSVVSALILWLALLSGLGLVAAALFSLASFANQLSLLLLGNGKFVRDLWKTQSTSTVSWSHELWPMQWRIAVSWASSYFIFQLYSPVLFAYYGPVAAGQMGLSVTALQGITSISIVWINTRAPLFGTLIAQRHFDKLDSLFRSSVWRSFAAAVIGCLLFLTTAVILQATGRPIGARFLSPVPLLFLAASSLINLYIYGRATYLRAHKQEPYLKLSIVHGIANLAVVYVLGRLFGPLGMTAGTFCTVACIGWWSHRIFINKRHEWHGKTPTCQPAVVRVLP